jgi:diguanylate cyclase (GGDEF)-like protein
VRLGDTVVRLGGDEFLIVADDLGSASTAALAARLTTAVAAPITVVGGGVLTMSVSIGHTPIRPDHADVGELIAAADHAMYTARHQQQDQRV